jgi:hypothetical protein
MDTMGVFEVWVQTVTILTKLVLSVFRSHDWLFVLSAH